MAKTTPRYALTSTDADSTRSGSSNLSAASALRVARALRLLESGFYDQPDVLDEALDRMIDSAQTRRPARTARQIA